MSNGADHAYGYRLGDLVIDEFQHICVMEVCEDGEGCAMERDVRWRVDST